MVSDFPAGDRKIANLFYSVVRTENKENEESFIICIAEDLPSSVLPGI